jgi:large subunit ribosomal protein L11
MSKEKIELIIEGGKASPNAQIAQKAGPLGININNIINSINDKTTHFKGMKIPVKIILDTTSKNYDVEIGSPSVSELIKKEINIEKGSGMPDKEKIGNLSIEQVIKIALMKKDSMLVKTLKAAVKNVIGSCNSLGVLVEGKKSVEINKDINSGIYDKEINSQKTEVSKEKLDQLKNQLEEINKEIKKQLEKEKAIAEKLAEKKVEVAKPEAAKEGEVPAAGKETAPATGKEATPSTGKETAKPEAGKEFEKKAKK